MKVTILLFCLFCWTGMAHSQSNVPALNTRPIQGIVFELNENEEEEPVIGATVKILNPTDSSFVTAVSSGDEGTFRLPSVKPANYLLAISFLGYTTHYQAISIDQFKEKDIHLGKIRLNVSARALSEVIVTGEVPDVIVKEDTTEFNAAAFKTQQGAVVEDLIKKLPGMEVDAKGTIKYAGKEVKQVLVDGKEFFGKDPQMATKNIPTNVIDKVQVIDKKTDAAIRTGVEDGEKETILNLSVKKGMNKGWMINASAGVGALIDNPSNEPARYSGNAMISRFDNGDNVSLVFNSGNTDNEGFSMNRFAGYGGSGGGGGGGGGGITSTSMIGLNINKSKNKKLTFNGGVSYNYSDALSKNKNFRQNILVDSVSYSERISENQRYSNGLRFNSTLEFKPDTLNTFRLETSIGYSNTSSRNISFQNTRAGDIDSTLVNQSEATTNNQSEGWNLNTSFSYYRNFHKKGRRFSIIGNFSSNQNRTDGNNLSFTEFFLQPDRNQRLNQDSENNMNNLSYSLRTTYVEPVWGEKNTLQFSYDISKNQTDNIRETYDYNPLTDTYSILNPNYSKSLDNDFINQRANVSFNSSKEKYSYNIGLGVIPSYTKSRSYIKNGASTGNDSILNHVDGRDVINYAPQARFSYKVAKGSNLNINYNGRTNQPSVSQLDPTVNNTNPLYMSSGNPDLLPSFSNQMSLNYSSYQQEKQRALNLGMSFYFTQNEIINFTDYEESTGIQYSMPINENGSWGSSAYLSYNLPLNKKKSLRFSTNTHLNYSNRVGYMMIKKKSERNTSGTFGVNESVSLKYSKDWFYGQLSGNYGFSKTNNSLDSQNEMESYDFGISYDTNLKLPKDWEIYSTINYVGNRGLSAGYNTDEVLWNMQISKVLFKKKQGTISLQWNDILQEKVNISRNVTGSYIEDSQYNALTSYFMVKFSYRFNQMGNSKGSGSEPMRVNIINLY